MVDPKIDSSDGPSTNDNDDGLDEALRNAQEEIEKARKAANSATPPPMSITIQGGGCNSDEGITVSDVLTGVGIVGGIGLAVYAGTKLYESFSGRTVLGNQRDLFSFKGSGFK
jgi:hypothetical protein